MRGFYLGVFTTLMVLVMLHNLRDPDFVQFAIEIVQYITPRIVIENGVAIIFVVLLTSALVQAHPVFRWNLFMIFPFSRKYGGMNIHLLPAQVPVIGPFFLLLFATHIPWAAYLEEMIFREGTSSPVDGLIRSVIFGMVHCLVGVPIGAGISLSVVGMWYTHIYVEAGLLQSTVYHTTYNLILVGVLFLMSVMGQLAPRPSR